MAAEVLIGGGGGGLLHATANMTYYLHHHSQGSGSAGNTPVADPNSPPALPFDLSEFMLPDDQVPVVDRSTYGEPNGAAVALPAAPVTGHHACIPSSGDNSDARIAAPRGNRRHETTRIAFRTKSEVEILDDGFKWRKYGKKSVKNNSHPRNYYRCSTDGCFVKKRVERDTENPSYVITTYEGTHNHMSPGVVYYTTQDTATGQFYVAGCEMSQSF